MITNRRPGLTLLEVLLLLVLLVILGGLVLVFVLQQREKAHRYYCANQLKTIGEGFYHFMGITPKHLENANHRPFPGPAFNFLPPAYIAEGYATWAVLLAPYVQATNPLHEWNLQAPYFRQPTTARTQAMTVFFCPSRQRSALISLEGDVGEKGGEHLAGAVGDYAVAAGDGHPLFPWTTAKANGAIIIGEVLEKKDDLILRWRGRTSLAALKRGLSNTLLVGEKHVPQDRLGQAAVGDGSLYNGGHPANCARVGGPGFGLARTPTDPFNSNFGSSHPGVCQFLLADGSVRTLNDTIDETVLGRLMVREESFGPQ